MDQGIIATLKRKYKSKMLHAMVKTLKGMMSCEQLESIPAGVRGLNHAYAPNLFDAATIAYEVWESDAATIAYEVWESIGQTTLVNCWLKADILPACHVESFETYRRPLELPAVDELIARWIEKKSLAGYWKMNLALTVFF